MESVTGGPWIALTSFDRPPVIENREENGTGSSSSGTDVRWCGYDWTALRTSGPADERPCGRAALRMRD
ncbi:hypothetical protein Sros01_77360 [Streptomyces roseochromogenus]|nr:hypothetical protein Sros01_77360 [Streptomyces roseochromogenus]